MKQLNPLFKALAISLAAFAVVWLSGCNSQQAPPTTPAASEVEFEWPSTLHIAATGASGEAKTVSWAAVMETDLNGPLVRVVNVAAWTNTYKEMAAGNMVVSQIDKSTLRDCVEAIDEYASPDGGPWIAGLVWIDSLASTGFMVRGDSDIRKPEDIQSGTKIAIWNDKSATMSPFRSLLAWAGVSEDDIIWVNTGDYAACPRAVAEGRADICMAAPVAPSVMEASAAPNGIRYIELDPRDNPAGVEAFLELSPLYDFGPIAAGPQSCIGTWSIISYKYLGADMNADPALVYNIATWLDENYDKYKDRYASNTNMTLNDLVTALQTIYIPVHPGLIQYLEEKGIWDEQYEARNQKNLALFEQYHQAYQTAMLQAANMGIEVKSSNQTWLDYWENFKIEKGLPLIKMHLDLTHDSW
ncbi:MAG: ABC transporter substrate-binding protein [Dehalococcoidaceae bacterium]|nr:ABC transporter substrate-binding protein [Dehalococcoidaceae bacterium]